MRTCLTIAGSDPSGGAGIQTDLKTFAAHGVYGLSAIAAITAQNTLGVISTFPIAPDLLIAQIDAVVTDLGADATKIGMLATAANVAAVADAVERLGLPNVVLDPVMRSSSGTVLLEPAGVETLRSRLLPRATVITPNLAEAGALADLEVRTLDDAREAARRLADLGARAVVITGGHLGGPPIDLVWVEGRITEISGPRVNTRQTHGTGCTFAAALAASLALGGDLLTAARSAKAYVTRALERAPGLGRGRGPLGHF
jgi:hydroxymethylpyrimidine/phosphomethylpyrimidine kinase